jgi:hypothetical protein
MLLVRQQDSELGWSESQVPYNIFNFQNLQIISVFQILIVFIRKTSFFRASVCCHCFAYVAYFVFLKDIRIRTQGASVASTRATILTTHHNTETVTNICFIYYPLAVSLWSYRPNPDILSRIRILGSSNCDSKTASLLFHSYHHCSHLQIAEFGSTCTANRVVT